MSEPLVSTRPLAQRVVLWGVLLLALWNLGRAVALYWQADWTGDLGMTPDLRQRMALAIVWAILFLAAALVLTRRAARIGRLVPLLLALFGVYELGMMIAFTTEPPAPLLVFVYAAFVCFAGWALWRPRGKVVPTIGNEEIVEQAPYESEN